MKLKEVTLIITCISKETLSVRPPPPPKGPARKDWPKRDQEGASLPALTLALRKRDTGRLRSVCLPLEGFLVVTMSVVYEPKA